MHIRTTFSIASVILLFTIGIPYVRSKHPQQTEATFTAAPAQSPYDAVLYDQMHALSQMLSVLEQHHYSWGLSPNDLKEAFEDGFNALLHRLDPHSAHLNEKIYKGMIQSTSGQFYGIGVVIDNTRTNNDPGLMIIDVIDEGPADKEGIRPHDKIVEIAGEPLTGMSTEEAISKIKGERGTKVALKVLREDASDVLEFFVARDIVKEQNLLSFYIPEHNMVYVSLATFSENAAQELEQILTTATATKKPRALILDLRNNTGGLLDAAVDIAGLFVPKGSLIVQTKKSDGTVVQQYQTRREPLQGITMPILVLINNYTASAAEILAGALCITSKQYNNGKNTKEDNSTQVPLIFSIGNTTFGKGSVQNVIPVKGTDSAIKVTSFLYYLPENTSVQAAGVTPDFFIERTLKQTEHMKWLKEHFGREAAFKHCLKPADAPEEDKTKSVEPIEPNKHLPWAERVKKSLQDDNQCKTAIGIGNAIEELVDQCSIAPTSRDQLHRILQTFFISSDTITLEQQ